MSTPTPQVAPQFIASLQEQAEEHLVRALQNLNAPPELLELVDCLRILNAYQQFHATHPTQPFIGIEDVTLQTVNLLFQDKAGAHNG